MADVGYIGCIRLTGFPGEEHLRDLFFQLVKAGFAQHRCFDDSFRIAPRFQLIGCHFGFQIHFVHKDDTVHVLRVFQKLFVLFRQPFVLVDQQKNQIGFGQGFAAAFDSDLFHDIIRFADARCVDQLQWNASDIHVFLDRIAGCAGDVGHDGFLFTQQAVQQTGFAYVRAADDGCLKTFAQDLPLLGGIQQVLDVSAHFNGAFLQELRRNFLDVIVFRVVDVHFDFSQGVQDDLTDIPDHAGQFAVQLMQGHIHRTIGFGTNQVHDSFSLRQINPAVQEGALREFPGLRHAGAVLEDRLQNPVDAHDTAVAVDFHDIFAGECLRSVHDGHHDLVDHVACARII